MGNSAYALSRLAEAVDYAIDSVDHLLTDKEIADELRRIADEIEKRD